MQAFFCLGFLQGDQSAQRDKHEAVSNPTIHVSADGASLNQTTFNGVEGEVIKVGERVTAGYRCGRGCTDPTIF